MMRYVCLNSENVAETGAGVPPSVRPLARFVPMLLPHPKRYGDTKQSQPVSQPASATVQRGLNRLNLATIDLQTVRVECTTSSASLFWIHEDPYFNRKDSK